MATHHSNGRLAVAAVGYVRRSTTKQEKSIDDQRREIERYAEEHGYRIVRWFVDDGISGDSTDKRDAFQAMHKAATNGRDFDLILCWDYSRFGRFNSLEAGYWIHPLVKAGVRLETVAEGPVEWTDFTGRIVNAIQAEGKHQFLVDLSRNTARGQITTAQAGFLCGQAAPYGYDRMLVDEHGEHRQRVRNGERFAKPKNWRVKLVPSDDPAKVETLMWLFTTYAETDAGLRSLADTLNARGVPGPTGGPWYGASLKAILGNHAYIGRFTWAKRRLGKYHRVASTTIKERDRNETTVSGEPAAVINPQADWIVHDDAHEALVERDVFDRAQAKLHERRRRQPQGYSYRTHTKSNGDAYLLTGLVYCQHCGEKMHGTRSTRHKGGKTYIYFKYLRSTYCRSGKHNPHGCGNHGVEQTALVALLVRKLRDAVLCGGHRDRLQDAVRRHLLAARQPVDQNSIKRLKRQISDLDAELTTGARRLLRVPDEVADIVATELASVRRERDRLAATLAGMSTSKPSPGGIDKEVDAVVDRLWRLDGELQHAEPTRLREVLRRMVGRIELRFDHVPHGKRVECPIRHGRIMLRPDPCIFGSVSRGDRI